MRDHGISNLLSTATDKGPNDKMDKPQIPAILALDATDSMEELLILAFKDIGKPTICFQTYHRETEGGLKTVNSVASITFESAEQTAKAYATCHKTKLDNGQSLRLLFQPEGQSIRFWRAPQLYIKDVSPDMSVYELYDLLLPLGPLAFIQKTEDRWAVIEFWNEEDSFSAIGDNIALSSGVDTVIQGHDEKEVIIWDIPPGAKVDDVRCWLAVHGEITNLSLVHSKHVVLNGKRTTLSIAYVTFESREAASLAVKNESRSFTSIKLSHRWRWTEFSVPQIDEDYAAQVSRLIETENSEQTLLLYATWLLHNQCNEGSQDIQKTISYLREELDVATRELAEARAGANRAETLTDILKLKSDESKVAYEDALRNLEGQLVQMTTHQRLREVEMSSLKEDLRIAQQKRDEAEGLRDLMNTHNERLEATIVDLRSQISEEKGSHSVTRSQLNMTKMSFTEVNEAKANLQTELDRVKQVRDDHQARATMKTEQVSTLEKKLKASESTISKLHAEMQHIEKRYQTSVDSIAAALGAEESARKVYEEKRKATCEIMDKMKGEQKKPPPPGSSANSKSNDGPSSGGSSAPRQANNAEPDESDKNTPRFKFNFGGGPPPSNTSSSSNSNDNNSDKNTKKTPRFNFGFAESGPPPFEPFAKSSSSNEPRPRQSANSSGASPSNEAKHSSSTYDNRKAREQKQRIDIDKARNGRRWITEDAITRFKHLLATYPKLSFTDTEPLTHFDVPWPLLTDPLLLKVETISAQSVKVFLEQLEAAEPEDFKRLLTAVVRVMHTDKWFNSRLRTFDSEPDTRKDWENAVGEVSKTLNNRREKCK